MRWAAWIAVAALAVGLAGAGEDCPPECECYLDEDEYRAARCFSLPGSGGGRFPGAQGLDSLGLVPRAKPLKLGPAVFKPFKSLKLLNLSDAGIAVLPEDVFAGLSYVIEIDLSYNRLKHLSGGAFARLTSLKTLVLRGNPLALTTRGRLVSKSLLELDLGECNLRSVPAGSLGGVPSLTHLALDSNRLETLSFDVLPPRLRYLNLARNRVSRVPTDVLLAARQLRRLDLSGNPVECTCRLLLTQDYLSGRGAVLENDVVCAGPPEAAGKPLSSLSEDAFCRKELAAKGKGAGRMDRYHRYRNNVQSDQPSDPHPAAEVVFSDEETRALGTHMEMTDSFEFQEASEDYEDPFAAGEEEADPEPEEEDFSLDDTTGPTQETTLSTTPAQEDASEPPTTAAPEETGESSTTEEPGEEWGSLPSATTGGAEEATTTTTPEPDSASTPESESTTEPEPEPSTTPAVPAFPEGEEEGEEPLTSLEPSTTRETPPETTTPASLSSSSSSTAEPTETAPVFYFPENDYVEGEGSTTLETTTEEATEGTATAVFFAEVEGEGEGEGGIEDEASSKEEFRGEDSSSSATETRAEIGSYLVVGGLALLVASLVALALCKRRKVGAGRKLRLEDPESPAATEMRDMDSLSPSHALLPKPPENGVKIVAKDYGEERIEGREEEAEEEAAPMIPPQPNKEALNGGGLGGPTKATARLTLLPDSIPQTPVFVHKSKP